MSGLVVSPKVIQYPYITKKKKKDLVKVYRRSGSRLKSARPSNNSQKWNSGISDLHSRSGSPLILGSNLVLWEHLEKQVILHSFYSLCYIKIHVEMAENLKIKIKVFMFIGTATYSSLPVLYPSRLHSFFKYGLLYLRVVYTKWLVIKVTDPSLDTYKIYH